VLAAIKRFCCLVARGWQHWKGSWHGTFTSQWAMPSSLGFLLISGFCPGGGSGDVWKFAIHPCLHFHVLYLCVHIVSGPALCMLMLAGHA
jgi:hypothetical protein